MLEFRRDAGDVTSVTVALRPATWQHWIFYHSYAQPGRIRMSDGKYFASGKKGEIFELKQALNSTKKSEKRDAVKKVIASMTVGKDVRCATL